MRNTGWKKHKLESRMLGEISITSDMQMIPPLGKKWRGTKEPLEGERGAWKSWLKIQHSKNEAHSIWSHHFMAIWWGNNGNSDKLYFLGLQNHCRWWLQPWNKRCLLFERKAMTNLDSILKSRDITLPTKVHLVKVMVFPIVIYGCESWTIKESWALKNWCFWTVVLEKTLENPLDCKGDQTSQS